jgi:hypothetical protein
MVYSIYSQFLQGQFFAASERDSDEPRRQYIIVRTVFDKETPEGKMCLVFDLSSVREDRLIKAEEYIAALSGKWRGGEVQGRVAYSTDNYFRTLRTDGYHDRGLFGKAEDNGEFRLEWMDLY